MCNVLEQFCIYTQKDVSYTKIYSNRSQPICKSTNIKLLKNENLLNFKTKKNTKKVKRQAIYLQITNAIKDNCHITTMYG